ncbi:MAG TPA: hypothetical protein VM124_03175 [Candidatus Limnocylindrales bacterium]|nr:hypothetical protein [Candidatus Limnocylindrales bacterium]
MTYRVVFEVAFASDEDRTDYIASWEAGSEVIQTYPGARGTRLHSALGRNGVFAVAEWESKEARDAAFEAIRRDHGEDADRILGENGYDEQFGEVTLFATGDEIAAVPSIHA